MSKPRNATLGEIIYNRIENDEYLQEIYSTILYNYSMHLIHKEHRNKPINKEHALRFADILSKSYAHPNSDKHRLWSQEIVVLLNSIYPNDAKIKAYASSILSNIGNYRGLQLIKTKYKNTSLLDEIYENFDMEYLSIPYQENKHFFHKQKEIYEHLDTKTLSYSGPTSMGKSLLMRTFIKDKILNGFKGNFAIVVPTKALITEISLGIMKEDLKDELSLNNYKIITSGNSLFFKQNNMNYIMVLTPERLLYTIISYPSISIDYLFIDEAHKITEIDGRSAFYYKITDMLSQKERKPHVILASPNIPNPDEFFNFLPLEQRTETMSIVSSFSPVSQLKYIVDLSKNEFCIFNDKYNKNQFIKLDTLSGLQDSFEAVSHFISMNPNKSNIIYCNGKEKTIEFAKKYAENQPILNSEGLELLANNIRDEIHDSYFLVELIKKGIAYHIGYLPQHIRSQIEECYKEGLIKTLFCTSTLIEGVNLPADNLFVITCKRGKKIMTPVEFKNLLGRVGRIKYNLYGNVFIIRDSKQSEKTIKNLLQNNVPNQKISLKTGLNDDQKNLIVDSLVEGTPKFKQLPNQSDQSYDLMRKIGLILLRDIVEGRQSVIMEEFHPLLDPIKISIIRNNFNSNTNDFPKPDDDINISIDQTRRLIASINNGLIYPKLVDDKVNYNDLKEFLYKLSDIFNWQYYEKKTIGNGSSIDYYATILCRWMNGSGLKQILDNALKYNREHKSTITIHGNIYTYDDSVTHKNVVIANTLEIIESVILFKLANYFLKFSTEYKKIISNGLPFDNDWYEFIEYGSTNELTIFLQRNGLTRDTSEFIKENKDKFVIKQKESYKLKSALLSCGKKSIEDELKDIFYNVSELFVD